MKAGSERNAVLICIFCRRFAQRKRNHNVYEINIMYCIIEYAFIQLCRSNSVAIHVTLEDPKVHFRNNPVAFLAGVFFIRADYANLVTLLTEKINQIICDDGCSVVLISENIANYRYPQ